MHGSVVGIHRHLDGVAHVVAQSPRRRRVREPVGDRVAIQEPDDAPRRRDHHVGVIVVPEKWGDALDPLADVPVQQHPARRRQVVRHEELDVPEVRREQHLAPEGPERDAPLPLVRGVDVLVPRRVVEFLGPSLHEDIVSGQLAEVELRAGDPEIGGGRWRDVLDPELGEPLARHPVHRPHHGTVAVRIRQPLVDPDPARQILRRELPRRQGHLPVLPVDAVPIDIDIRELVVGPDLLELAVGGEQGPRVPQADILEGRLVLTQVLKRQCLLCRKLPLLDIVQAVGQTGVADVEVDVRLLLVDLVGRHPIALDQARVGHTSQDRHAHQRGEAPQEGAPAPETNRDETQDSNQARQDQQRPQDRELGVNVGIPGAKDHTPLGEEQVEHGQPVPDRLQDQHEGSKPQEVSPGPSGDRDTGRRDLNASGTEMHRAGGQA